MRKPKLAIRMVEQAVQMKSHGFSNVDICAGLGIFAGAFCRWLRDSVYWQVLWAISSLGSESWFEARLSPVELTHLLSQRGSQGGPQGPAGTTPGLSAYATKQYAGDAISALANLEEGVLGMAVGTVSTRILTGIANAIRCKAGVATTYKPRQMAAAAAALDGTDEGGFQA